MTRIIAGFAGSLKLNVPDTGTRPTSDRVREAIFSSLESRDAIRGARVVDLYAGSGALGLEAASRGAASVALVERAPTAVRACRDNVATVLKNAPSHARPTIAVVPKKVNTFLEAGNPLESSTTPKSSAVQWDLVFIDPPYDITDVELSDALAALVPRVARGAHIVVERATASHEPLWPNGISLDRRRNYGDTTLWWASAD